MHWVHGLAKRKEHDPRGRVPDSDAPVPRVQPAKDGFEQKEISRMRALVVRLEAVPLGHLEALAGTLPIRITAAGRPADLCCCGAQRLAVEPPS